MKTNTFFLISTLLLVFSCKDPVELSSEKEILSFSVAEQLAPNVINSEAGTVTILMDTNTNLSEISPQITVSDNATINPASGQPVDFSKGNLTYTVIAQDNSTKPWSVTIETPKSNEADILTFYLDEQKAPSIIGDSTVYMDVNLGTNLSSLTPKITLSPKATVQPSDMEAIDFSGGPVMYTVTSESGIMKNYKVMVTSGGIYAANILTYTIPNQVGESVFKNTTVNITVPMGYDLTSVIPTITVSEGAKIDPESGVAANFATAGLVTYTITTPSGSQKKWRVYVTEAYISADHPLIQYMGRVDFTNPLKPKLYAPGTSISIKFKGTYCQILINDEVRWGSNHNYLELVVDGNQFTRLKTTGPKNTIDIIKNLPDGEHTLLITKATEAGIGYLELVGFRCNELLEPTPAPERRIEFIGNSITCGYGNDQSQFTCDAGEWYDQHNAYFAYGPEVARRLNAQWMLTSVSGIGLIHSCCDITYEMPDVYEKVNLSPTGLAWDFTKYPADVVTICLGQNDGIQDSTTFCSAYVTFIGTVRGKYPDASIVCITSPMADNNLYNSQKNYLTGIVDYMNSHSDSKVYKHFLSHNLTSGCDYHPNMEQHQQIAGELEVFLKETLGW